MKLLDRRRLGAQRGHLPQHEETMGCLVFVAHRAERRARPCAAIHSLGGDPQTADVQAFQGLANFLGRSPLGQQPLAFSSSKRATNGVRLTRTWWPGPDSSRTVSSQRTTSS